MVQSLKTSAFKRIKPGDLTKTVEQTVVEAITNRRSEPESDAPAATSCSPRGWRVSSPS
jgi:hypothetical protein